MKKAIFIDRDGTLLREPADEQIDALDKVAFVPGAISGLRALTGLGYELVMASNQDGLGTASFPEETFWPVQNFLLQTLEGEGVVFDDILIDPSMPEEHSPNRKPGTGMFGKYLDGSYDLAASWVVGDRETDRQLAANLGAQALLVGEHSWAEIAETIRSSARSAVVARKTKETDIYVRVDLDGKGPSGVDTGLKFFDHMLSQLITHGGIALEIRCKGDLEVDEHHTMEDVGIALGEALREALGDKRGIERYGFALPMASPCRWTRRAPSRCSTSAAAASSSGMSNSPANTWVTCPRRCSSISSSPSPTRCAPTFMSRPAARTTTTSPRVSSRRSPARCGRRCGAMYSLMTSLPAKDCYDRPD